MPAFNLQSMERGLAIMNAVRACDAPVILQARLNFRRGCRVGALDPRVAAA